VTAGPAAVLEAAATLTLAEVVGRSVLRHASASGASAAVAFAAAVAIAGIVLDGGPASVVRAAARSAWLAVAAAAMIVAHAGGRVDARVVAGLALGVGTVTLAAAGATRLLGELLGSPARGRLAVCIAIALAGTAPLWLGPAVERLGGPGTAVDAVVAVSPLTYLSVMGGYDYLHEDWFYVRSPLASLRFAYPAGTVLTAGWLALGALLLHAARVLPERWRRG
jgi:hypothetical protein